MGWVNHFTHMLVHVKDIGSCWLERLSDPFLPSLPTRLSFNFTLCKHNSSSWWIPFFSLLCSPSASFSSQYPPCSVKSANFLEKTRWKGKCQTVTPLPSWQRPALRAHLPDSVYSVLDTVYSAHCTRPWCAMITWHESQFLGYKQRTLASNWIIPRRLRGRHEH